MDFPLWPADAVSLDNVPAALRDGLGKGELTACQASKRSGTVGVPIDGDRAVLTSNAVTVLRGTLGRRGTWGEWT